VSSAPHLGAAIPRRGSAAARGFGRALLGLLRWRVAGEVPDLPRFVVAVGPHTSNWDFVVGAAAMFALDLRLSFLGKHTLFRGPFAAVLRWMGGIPVDRTSPHGVVAESVTAFLREPRRILAIAPEGTRRKGAGIRSGFLHIARGAGVPVMIATLDYRTRCVTLGPTFMPGEDVEADVERVRRAFAAVRGKRAR
jgi:1-acyl-sn-glycerol-3-phosphate acyltransferase